jgi:hypothetical protein
MSFEYCCLTLEQDATVNTIKGKINNSFFNAITSPDEYNDRYN